MKFIRTQIVLVGLVSILTGLAQAAPGPGIASPWDGSSATSTAGRSVPVATGQIAGVPGPGIQVGADHIITDQCPDGGWGWSPHGDCSATFHNITAPIALGLLDAFAVTDDPAHLAAAAAGGDFDVTSGQYPNGEPRFGAFTPFFMWRLSSASGDPSYADFTAIEFFDALSAGTYGPSDLDTAGWISAVQSGRAGVWANLLPWEFHNLISTSRAIGNPGQDALFLQGLLDGLNTLDRTNPFGVYVDIIGLAGGVRGLALSSTTGFPAINSPNDVDINGIDNLQDLANTLAGYQNPDGSWYWHSNLPAPGEGDKDTQTTAYAVMALDAADTLVAADYSAVVNNGRAWLLSMQAPDGSFLAWPGGDKNTEVEAEALSALPSAGPRGPIPTLSTWGLLAMGIMLLTMGRIYFRRRLKANAA